MSWQEEFKKKLVSAEEAVRLIKSGDRVIYFGTGEPLILLRALAQRKNELENVQIFTTAPHDSLGWFSPGWEKNFKVTVSSFLGNTARPAIDAKIAEYLPSSFDGELKALDEGIEKGFDVTICMVSPPDSNGFCSFGPDFWQKKIYCRNAKRVIAEVNKNLIRTCGDNFIHVTEIERFTEYTPPVISDEEITELIAKEEPEERRQKLVEIIKLIEPERRSLWIPAILQCETKSLETIPAELGLTEPDEVMKEIARNVSTLIRDGDTIQVGARRPTGLFARLGVFDNHMNLGYHGEMSARGIIRLIREGVITGKKKNFYPEKAIFGAITGADVEELKYANNNPLIELYDAGWVANPKVVGANDNMVGINSTISLDLTGQITAESTFGGRVINGPGGQPGSHIGAILSKGGKAITALSSTALHGAVSRIVPYLEQGAIVTIPRYYADYVVTEFGIVRVMGKTLSERAEALISIAHPDFRSELRKEAKKLF